MGVVYLLVAVFGGTIAVFAIQNLTPVVIQFLGWRIEGALSLVVLLSILAGIVLTSVCGLVPHWRLRSRIRQLESRLGEQSAAAPPRVDEPPR